MKEKAKQLYYTQSTKLNTSSIIAKKLTAQSNLVRLPANQIFLTPE